MAGGLGLGVHACVFLCTLCTATCLYKHVSHALHLPVCEFISTLGTVSVCVCLCVCTFKCVRPFMFDQLSGVFMYEGVCISVPLFCHIVFIYFDHTFLTEYVPIGTCNMQCMCVCMHVHV